MPAESTVYRWLKSSAKADRLRQALQQVDLQNEFREFLREKFARVVLCNRASHPIALTVAQRYDCAEAFEGARNFGG